MDKTAQTERYRLFLIEALPPPLTPASQHLQIFDGYIDNSRLRVRRIRDPHTKEWNTSLQQRFRTGDDTAKLAEIHLNNAEYSIFESLPVREIRKNRYFHEFDGRMYTFDVYLGQLAGLITARVELEPDAELDLFEVPAFASIDVTTNPFFDGVSLSCRNLKDVELEIREHR